MLHEDFLPTDEPIQHVTADGTRTDAGSQTDAAADLLDAYRLLVQGRRINDQCMALVRQGRLAVYPSSHGQEACQVGVALSLHQDDWLFPTYRDAVAVISRGVDPAEVLTMFTGEWHCGYNPVETRTAPQATPLATQLLHAVGFAHAAKMRGDDTVAFALIGDGATSEGDFHEALNFAAVYRAPVVFFVQNNEFAISVPLDKQTAAASLAHKAIGYGMPGVRVDGNDIAAVLAVTREARARAAAGEGPTLIEAHTYRMLAHTNADDDTRYRDRADVAAWAERDPLTRVRALLRADGLLDDDREAEFTAQAELVAERLRAPRDDDSTLDPEDLFRWVYSERTPQLEEQWQRLRQERERDAEFAGGAR